MMENQNNMNGVLLIEEAYALSNIPIVFVTCKEELIYTVCSIKTILDVCSDLNNYDILVIHQDLSELDSSRLENMAEKKENVSVRVLKVQEERKNGYVEIPHRYLYKDTVKLFLPYILKRYFRFIIVENGTLFKEDIALCDLLSTDDKSVLHYSNDNVWIVYAEKYRNEISIYGLAQSIIANEEFNMVKMISELLTEEIINKFESNTESSFIYEKENNRKIHTVYFGKVIKNTFCYETFLYNEKAAGTDIKQNIKKSGRYLFPFEKVAPGMNVVIYGAGKVGKQYMRQLRLSDYCNIVAVVDKNSNNAKVDTIPIKSPEMLSHMEFDLIVIAVAKSVMVDEIYNYLVESGIDKEKIVAVYERELWQ